MPQLSVIIPARNEEASLGTCLESLVGQTGVDFEIILVNDHSTDRTREIAEKFPKVCVVDAVPLPEGWTGKNNAVATGARKAGAQWLLFTDADTIHSPGSLARALAEAKDNKADVLSYSPEQIAVTFWEMAILPVVFAELARQFPPSKVSDPKSPEAAANGQFILIKRQVYDAIGGHTAVAAEILEDVAFARRVKAAGYKLRFRYSESVRTRMYHNFAQLREGWTKNLALLFPKPGWLAIKSMTLWVVPLASAIAAAFLWRRWWWGPVFLGSLLWLSERLRRANFDSISTFLGALFGMPMFAYLLFRSKRAHAKGSVGWKGRTYEPKNTNSNRKESSSTNRTGNSFMKTPLALLLLTTALIAFRPATLHAQSAEDEPHFANTVIEPGQGIGPLKINDSRDKALQLFPKKAIDQEWEDPCGTTIDWTDSTNPQGHGDVFIRSKKGKIFQIESSTTRFQTAEGITIFDPPEKVRSAYKDMRAGVLLGNLSPALGSRPLVFWFDKKKGIAFAFAYDRPHHKRYVYKVIVFEPGKNFCPEQETINSNSWQSIEPYSQEPPRELSPEAQ